MRHERKIALALILCLSSIFLSGCWDQKIFEDIGFILQLGLEKSENGKLLYSVTLPVVEETVDENIEILWAEVQSLREGRERLRNMSGKRVEGGKTQHIHFSKELAQQGVGGLLDVYLRSPENPLLANIIVVDGSPLDLFKTSLGYKDKTRVAIYVTEIIDDARKRSATPETRIYDFIVKEHSKTIDPVATLLRFDIEKIEVVGSALFHGDKMVGELDCDETGLLHSLMGEKINFEYYFRKHYAQDEENSIKKGMALLLKKVKRKVKIEIKENVPQIKLTMAYKSTIDEFSDKHRLHEDEELHRIEQEAALSIKEDLIRILEYLKETGSDPVGFGEMVRAKHNQYFKSIQWDDIYKQIPFDVEVTVQIESYGSISG